LLNILLCQNFSVGDKTQGVRFFLAILIFSQGNLRKSHHPVQKHPISIRVSDASVGDGKMKGQFLMIIS